MKKSKMGLILAVLLLCSMIGTMAFASVNDDQVTSQKIREADGTSGQNTNSGSGVKTGHIQNGAVTTSKIAVSAVTSSVIANGAVTSATIADGAVTDAKIAGPIAASKISSTGLNADTVDGQHAADLAPAVHTHSQSQVTGLEAALAGKADVLHNHDSLYQQKYGKVAVVAQTGGDYTSPVDAMNNLASWCGTPSATNPCLVKIMPGVYDIGVNSLQVLQYVDVEGSGESATKILGTIEDGGLGGSGLLVAAGHSEVRSLTLENTGTGLHAIALLIAGANVKVSNVTALAHGADYIYAVYNRADDTVLLNVTATASGSKTPGYGQNIGIRNHYATATMINVKTSALDGNYNYGMYTFNTFGRRTILRNVEALASGGNVAVALNSYDSTIEMTDVNAVAANASTTTGFENYVYVCTFCTAKVDRSSIAGATSALRNISLNAQISSLFLGSSKIEGGSIVKMNANMKCIGVYDGNYDSLVCP